MLSLRLVRLMIEIELKFKIKDRRLIEEKLKNNFNFVQKAFEVTEMYDNAQKDLFKIDARLRVREIIVLSDKKRFCELTYKKPLSREAIKIEEEIKVVVDKYKELTVLLKRLGFVKVSSYERVRSTYHSGETEIVIDEFPFGDYLEIEGTEEAIKELAQQLGFKLNQNLTQSCDDIYAEIQQSLGKPIEDHIRFSEVKKGMILK